MLRGVALRLLQAIPVVVIFAVLVFTLLHLLPGDPAVAIAGSEATPEAIERIRQQLGLDRPVLEQLGAWFGRLAQGDFGKSLILNQSVLSAVVERLPVTLSLSFLSLTITIPVGITLGVLAAYWRNTWLDSLVMMSALVGVSMPSFWLGILSVIFFSVTLGWLPPAGYTPISQGLWPWLSALIQPAVVLALFQIGFLARITRSAMLDVLDRLGYGHVTVHGFRATFATWAEECTDYPDGVREAALAHKYKNETVAAYQRGAKLEKRRKLMDDWAEFCAPRLSREFTDAALSTMNDTRAA